MLAHILLFNLIAEKTEWKSSLKKYHNELRGGCQIMNVLPALRTLLTDVEYSFIEDKRSNAWQVDELVKILLTKDARIFEGFCSALERNGYSHWASKLRGKGMLCHSEMDVYLLSHYLM